MLLTKRMTCGLLLGLALACAGADLPHGVLAGSPNSAREPGEPKPKAKADAALTQARLQVARRVYEVRLKALKGGEKPRQSVEEIYRWSCRWLEAERELDDRDGDRLKALRGHLDRMRDLKRLAKELAKVVLGWAVEVEAAEFYVTEAQQWLARAKEKAKAK